jgi:hypothetical protein
MKIGEEIFNTLKGFGYLVELYDSKGKGPMSSPELAEYIYAKDKTSEDSVMIRLPTDDNNEYPRVVIYKSHSMDEKFKKLLMTIKNVALKHNGATVTFRQFGRNIEPKDLAYLPKGEQELEDHSMNESKDNLKELSNIWNKYCSKSPSKKQLSFLDGWLALGEEEREAVNAAYQNESPYGPVVEDIVPFKKKDAPRIKKMDTTKIHDKVKKIKGISQHGKLIANVSGVPTKVQNVVDENSVDKSPKGILRIYNKNHLLINYIEGTKNMASEYNKKHTGSFAIFVSTDELTDSKENVSEAAKYKRYGTTRSSYHVLPEAKKARVIIRHSKKLVDENSVGARSRNVKNLFVESVTGERRLIETKSLMCARAVANYVNNGGKLFDDISNKIIGLSEDMKKIKKLKRKYPVLEDAGNKKVHESLTNVYEGLLDFMKQLNTPQVSTLAEALNLSGPNVKFAETFYGEKLGEGYDVSSLARGSVLYTRTRKFLPN